MANYRSMLRSTESGKLTEATEVQMKSVVFAGVKTIGFRIVILVSNNMVKKNNKQTRSVLAYKTKKNDCRLNDTNVKIVNFFHYFDLSYSFDSKPYTGQRNQFVK